MSRSLISLNCTIPINDAILKYKTYINEILKSKLDQTNLDAVLKLIDQTNINSEVITISENKKYSSFKLQFLLY